MADGTVLDLRRTDLRSNTLENPYWITSAQLGTACDDQDALLFSFPITKSISPGYGNSSIIVQEIVLETNTVFAGEGATIAAVIGKGTIATDIITTGGVSTEVDPDEYWEATDGAADLIAVGNHFPANGSNWVTARIAGVGGAGYIITPLDANVPTVCARITADAAITAGAARFHMLISVVPVVS